MLALVRFLKLNIIMKGTIEISDSQFDKLIKQSIDIALGNIHLERQS